MQNQRRGRLTQVSKDEAAKMIAPQFSEVSEEEGLRRAKSFLDQEEVDSGIVVSRGAELRFWHLTFQEYLAARAIAGLREAAQQEILLTGDRLYLPEWREVMLLLAGILLVKQGKEKVDGLFEAVLNRLGPRASLGQRARCAGLLGALLADLRPLAYQPADPRYRGVLEAVLGIFDVGRVASIPFHARLEAAQALGQAGDPRLRQDNWVTLPGGTFWMGAQNNPQGRNYDPEAYDGESPVHQVTLAPFQIGRYPVTVEEYARFLEAGGRDKHGEPEDWQEQLRYPNCPVVNVSWFEATAYCAWAEGRLPTEAEWECAARGGREGVRYPWGNEVPGEHRANFGMKPGQPTPVGLYPAGATPTGIHDLAGNVWEWVADAWRDRYDGTSPDEKQRVVRGGSWGGDPSWLRVSSRGGDGPGDRNLDVGFRCAREVVSL
jgi:formylglycine-generating enzyme required for sulfatase activity